ncbi:unnamed protein product, partial [Mesorhabditis belari]|uniref:Myb-like domain-containing protein n=1 Tax=Mesorhabditis belari TaxID=2138241 RepID=A0AAF3FE03_9BILA
MSDDGLDTRSEVGSVNSTRSRRSQLSFEALDTKVMTMADLRSWIPKNEPKFEFKKPEDTTTTTEILNQPISSNKVFAPQVTIDADGKLTLDKSSLFVQSVQPMQNLEKSFDWNKLSDTRYSSFRKRYKPVKVWSEKETELFYDIISRTGTDFTLMHEFFPTRSPAELRNKFKREERNNKQHLHELMALPITLDKSLYRHADKKLKEIDAEERKKKEMKLKKKIKDDLDNQIKPRNIVALEQVSYFEDIESSTSIELTEKREVSTAAKDLLQATFSMVPQSPLLEEKKPVPVLRGYGK